LKKIVPFIRIGDPLAVSENHRPSAEQLNMVVRVSRFWLPNAEYLVVPLTSIDPVTVPVYATVPACVHGSEPATDTLICSANGLN
jgi:hypothetical protein